MQKHIFFFLIFLFGSLAVEASGESAPEGKAGQAAAYRDLGDSYAAREDLVKAAQAYAEALAIGGFSEDDRIKMATAISWTDPASATKEFRALVAANPANIKARLALARALLWTGDNKAALEELDIILQKDPGDREALLVKANALRAPGEFAEAVAIYNKLLKGAEDFDARAGLTEALLASGDLDAASAAVGALKPAHPYQEREVRRLLSSLESAKKPAETQKPQATAVPPVADTIPDLKAAIAAAPSMESRAMAYKKLGDAYAGKEDFKHAAAAYISALSLGKFPEAESVRMATTISWSNPRAAAKEFKAIVAANPENLKARTALARTLSWTGDSSGAIREIAPVLLHEPDNRDTLLIKANSLRWRGKTEEAAKIYSGLLEKGEDFDARSGLAYTSLAGGDAKEVRSLAAGLKPQYPYQEREVKGLLAALDAYARPTLESKFSYYHDTDLNNVRRYSLSYGRLLGRFRTSLGFTRTDASDPAMDNRLDTVSAGMRTKLSGSLDSGLGIAENVTKSGGNTGSLTWNAFLNKNFPGVNFTMSVSDSILSDTALLINNRIRATNYLLAANKTLPGRISLNTSYSYRDYSDGNNANDSQISASHPLFSGNPGVTAGYRFRYLAFNRQSRGGYYDPNGYRTHQIFASLSFETGRFYGSVDPYAGWQAQRRNAISDSSYYAGGAASLGFKTSARLAVELNGETGDYALQSATSFKYYQLGARLIYRP